MTRDDAVGGIASDARASVIAAQWDFVLGKGDEHIRAIARRAFQEPALRRLFPYCSLSNLRFSCVTEYPFDPMPWVATLHNPWGTDFYLLRDLDNRPLLAGDLDVVVCALVWLLEERQRKPLGR